MFFNVVEDELLKCYYILVFIQEVDAFKLMFVLFYTAISNSKQNGIM